MAFSVVTFSQTTRKGNTPKDLPALNKRAIVVWLLRRSSAWKVLAAMVKLEARLNKKTPANRGNYIVSYKPSSMAIDFSVRSATE